MDFTKVLTVDNNLRTITIPADVTLLGVTNDNNVNELAFAIPVTYNDVDLSDYTVYVNWMNANGEVGVAETETLESDDPTIMLRKWVVGVDPCKYAGDCKFILCLKSDGNEYNTQQAKLPVYKGIETDDTSVERYHTALTELVERIQELAGKYAWDGTTWSNFVKYDTTRKIAQESAAAARDSATAAVNAKNTVTATKTQIDQYLADLEEESNKISDIYEALDRTNPNICPREYLEINEGSTGGIINGSYQRFGHVYSGETYTFSADVTMSPLPGRLECRIKPDGGGANIEQVFYIDGGSTGRITQTFTAPGTGEIWFSGKYTDHAAQEKVLEHCQLEEGTTASPYSPYGYFLVADVQARRDMVALREDVEGNIATLHTDIEDVEKKFSPLKNILSVGHMGYRGYGAEGNTLRAFKDAKIYGYDWVELDVYATLDHVFVVMHDGKVDTATETNVDVWTVNYADITSQVLRFNSAVYTCNLYNLGMAIEFKGTHFTSVDYRNMRRIMEAVNVPHAYISWSVSNLVNIRAKEADAHVILVLNNMPTIEDLTNSDTYASLRTLAGQSGLTDICFTMYGSGMNYTYIYALWEMHIGLVAGATETIRGISNYLPYLRMIVTNDILAKTVIDTYFPIS